MKQVFRFLDLFSYSRKKVEIKVETKRTLKIRRLTKSFQKYCPNCRNFGLFITGQEAKTLVGGSVEKFEKLIETAELHFAESTENELLICVKSLNSEIECDREID